MDYIERKAVLKQAREALEAGGVDIDRFLLAMEQEVANAHGLDTRFQDFLDLDEGTYDPEMLAQAVSEVFDKGLHGES